MNSTKVTMTESEFAQRVGVSRITVWRQRRAGKLSHFKIGTRILYSEQHIIEFLNNHEKQARQSKRGKKEE